jgi:SHAQKYF class myb-like DNA-binding protein
VDWTPELQDVFVAAVEEIGVEKAMPSRVLEKMGSRGAGFSRQSIAGRLQSYRSSKKVIFDAEPLLPVPDAPDVVTGLPCWSGLRGSLHLPGSYAAALSWWRPLVEWTWDTRASLCWAIEQFYPPPPLRQEEL